MNTLVLYRSGERADAVLAKLARDAGRRLTVVALAPQEKNARGCCDTRSVMWNAVCRQLAQEHLARARLALDGIRDVDLELVGCRDRRRLRRRSPVPVVSP